MSVCKSLIQRSCIVLLVFGAGAANAAACLVVGDKTARVMSAEGEKSPVFRTQDCAALRLVSGQAQASWLGANGKLSFVPISKDGVVRPVDAAESERTLNSVWAEVSKRREAARPGLMRSLLPSLYLPQDGLVIELAAEAETTLVLSSIDADGIARELRKQQVPAGGAVKLQRAGLKQGEVYQLEIRSASRSEQFKWQLPADSELAELDERVNEIKAVGLDASQRLLAEAMLFEQRRMNVNRELALRNIRSGL